MKVGFSGKSGCWKVKAALFLPRTTNITNNRPESPSIKIFLGGGVPPGPENPYPIPDQKIRFSTTYSRPNSETSRFVTVLL